VCNSTFKRNDFHTDIVHAIEIWISMLFPHYLGHGSYLLQWKANMHFSHTRNSALTHFFLLLWITYRLLCGETDNAASSAQQHPLYTYYRTQEYIMAPILWSSWECLKYFGHVTRRSTPEVSIPALGRFLYVFSDFVINLHWRQTDTSLCRYFLNSHNQFSLCGTRWIL